MNTHNESESIVYSRGMSSGIEFAQTTPGRASVEPPDAKSGEQIPALCLHGIGGDCNSFEPQLNEFGSKRHIMAWNMPGYGRSAALDVVSFKTLAESVVQLLDQLQLEKIDLIGQSIGGMLAMETAIRFPNRVRSLTLIATTSAFGGRDDSFKKEFLEARLTPIEAGETMPALAERFVPEIVGNIIDPRYKSLAIESMSAVPTTTYKQILECLVTFNRRDDVSSLNQPCCLIAGSVDRNAPAKTMEKLAGNLPNAEYHCIDGAGHLTNIEAPARVNEIISRFLNGQDNVNA